MNILERTVCLDGFSPHTVQMEGGIAVRAALLRLVEMYDLAARSDVAEPPSGGPAAAAAPTADLEIFSKKPTALGLAVRADAEHSQPELAALGVHPANNLGLHAVCKPTATSTHSPPTSPTARPATATPTPTPRQRALSGDDASAAAQTMPPDRLALVPVR